MLHSIIIPNRKRDANLRICLASLRLSAQTVGIADDDWEVVVATDCATMPELTCPGRIAYVARPEGPFNKPLLLNAGIAASTGTVLTFMDADAIVGLRFMENPAALGDLTKFCYRVRRLSHAASDSIRDSADTEDAIRKAFSRYESFPPAHEGYGTPDRNGGRNPTGPVFGNSHFSIRRSVLGDLRFDETFCGRGFEDIHFNLLLWKQHFDTYNARMVTDADHAVLNLANPANVAEDWGPGDWNTRNFKRYKSDLGQFRREMRAKGVEI